MHEPTERLSARQVEDRLRVIVSDGHLRTARIGGRARVHGGAVVPAQRTPDPPVPEPAEVVRPADPPADRNAPPATAAEPMTRRNQPPAAAKAPPVVAVPAARAAAQPSPLPPVSPSPEPGEPDRVPSAGPPEPVEPRRRQVRFATLAAIIVALLAAGVTGAVLYRGDDRGSQAAGPIGSPVPSARASGEAAGGPGGFSPVVCQQKPAPNLPRTPQPGASRENPKDGYELLRGYSIYTDPSAGFRLAVPDGWTYERIDTTVCFRDPSNIRMMSLDYGRNPDGDPEKACRKEADRLVAAGALPGYEEIGIVPLPLSIKAADWEYTYDRRRRPDAFGDPLVRQLRPWFRARLDHPGLRLEPELARLPDDPGHVHRHDLDMA